MTKYRLGVQDGTGLTFWYDQETYDAAAYGWRLIRDYGRNDVTATVQQLNRNSGEWETLIGASIPANA